MGTLFPNSPEFPDYVAFPSLFLEAARAGVLPLVVASLLLATWDHKDHPHTHTEPFVLTPPVVPPPPPVDLSWLNNSTDVANDSVRQRHDAHRRAFYAMTQDSTSTSAAVLEFAR